MTTGRVVLAATPIGNTADSHADRRQAKQSRNDVAEPPIPGFYSAVLRAPSTVRIVILSTP